MQTEIIPFYKYGDIINIRLDGQLTGGNRKVFAYFDYNGSNWKIHSDTHLSELFKAYREIKKGNDPFKIKITNKGNTCIELINNIASKPKHLYIYFNK